MEAHTIPSSTRDNLARALLVAAVLFALLIAYGCQAVAPQVDTSLKIAGAFGTAAAAWIAALQQSGAITPEQAAQFHTVIGQAQTTIDAFAAAAKASADAVAATAKAAAEQSAKLQAELAEVKSKTWTPEEVAAVGTGVVGVTVAAVQKLRGPSATPAERKARRAAR